MFWEPGITDSITDKHRIDQGNIVIPVSVDVALPGNEPKPAEDADTEATNN